MIKLNEVSYTYNGQKKPALDKISLNIEKGEFIGIIGGCGAGKSTLTYTMNGIIPHHFKGDFYGEAIINGNDTFETDFSDLSRVIGSVLQDIDSQIVTSVVEDEILFGLENFDVPKDEIEERLENALEMVGISDLRERKISTLSGGQKQKTAIASIIALRPNILILDEPTGELDPASSVQVFEILKKLNTDYGMTIVVVEQKIALLCEYAKKLAVMNKGKIVCFDKVHKVLGNTDILKQTGINCPRIVTLSGILAERGITNGETAVSPKDGEKFVRRVLA